MASPPTPSPSSSSTSPTNPTPIQIASARAALVASISNTLDSSLHDRATALHTNATILRRQERDVELATAALRRDADALAREVGVAARCVKEVGSVQNWAEVLWRDFLVLEETVRLVNGGEEEEEEGEECGSQCSCEDSGEEEGVVDGVEEEEGGVGRGEGLDQGKGKGPEVPQATTTTTGPSLSTTAPKSKSSNILIDFSRL